MNRSWIRKIQELLEQRLTKEELLRLFGVSRTEMLHRLRTPHIRQKLKEMSEAPQYSCISILELCQECMERFAPDPLGGWLPLLHLHGKHILYPDNFPAVLNREQIAAARFYLEVLRIFLEDEPVSHGFSPTLHFHKVEKEELATTDNALEHRTFLKVCQRTWLFEFMRIASEVTPFQTLGHIAGVHYTAMHVARQLSKLGIEIDLPLMSAAAIGHDIGKFGCKEAENKRVPYLHYYYTDLFFKSNHMPVIGHIAANHSTWDLELENLSVESLVLIYADFRVKSVWENGKERIVFYTLKGSFDVILSKLDNVDDAKRERYRRVYDKLTDFEEYMKSLGVVTELDRVMEKPLPQTDTALLFGERIVQAYKWEAIAHNIRLMHVMNVEKTFANILEAARSEKDWKNIRSYLNIFQEYYTYTSPKQKLLIISLLQELLMHREGDIRAQAAQLMGRLIVAYDTDYRKEIPDGWRAFLQESSSLELFQKYFHMILIPDHKLTEQHRRWIMHQMGELVESTLCAAKPGKKQAYLELILDAYQDFNRDDFTAFTMINAVQKLPFSLCKEEDFRIVFSFVEHFAKRRNTEIQVAVLRLAYFCLKQDQVRPFVRGCCERLFHCIPSRPVISIQYLRYQIGKQLGFERAELTILEEFSFRKSIISETFLENLKTATPWICKEINIEFLLYLIEKGRNNQPLHSTTHLANLLMVSDHDNVRHSAGRALVEMSAYISRDQCNEVTVELFQGLENGGEPFSKDIPAYLAEMILRLQPEEVEEQILALEQMVIQNNEKVACAALDTLGHLVQKYPVYRERFHETKRVYQERLGRMLGLILKGMANYHERIAQEAVYVLGEYLFGSPFLTVDEKSQAFRFFAKKALHIVKDQPENLLSFLIHAAALNQIYRFLSDYLFRYGSFHMSENDKVAFFPGTFDPFSLSHKGIVQEIRNLGYEVYLAIDEFSWSKKTQPKLICRKIAAMSVADDNGVFLFPDDIPINIANPEDLKLLREVFPGKELSIVVGSDVVANASAYRKPVSEYSIHQLPHIIFRRNTGDDELRKEYPEILSGVRHLSLPNYLEDISSTRIRESIDQNRDISQLIDPVVQNYIYENSLYLREPQDKPVIRSQDLHCEVIHRLTLELDRKLRGGTSRNRKEKRHPEEMAVVLWDESEGHEPLAFCRFRPLALRDIMEEFGDLTLASRIRDLAGGKLMLISEIQSSVESRNSVLKQWILTEALAYALSEEYTYCIYHGNGKEKREEELLRLQGFLPMECEGDDLVMAAALYAPTILTDNIETVLKDPFQRDPKVMKVVYHAHRRLQEALTQFRPGHLVLSFDSRVMYNRMIDKIAEANDVPNVPSVPPKLGEKMCVPFGKLFRNSAAPNTVTKSLYTERVFYEDMSGFTIQEYPNYSPLRTQIKMIRSFQRDIILVDDLLHKGYRLREIVPLLKEANLDIDRILVGILTARGRDLAQANGLKADSVYFIPNVHSWLVASTMYPFIGGDSVAGSENNPSGLLPSVNLILPYVAPLFLMKDSRLAAYHLSFTCLENARDILRVLEEEYQQEFGRNLTLNRLSEAIISPTCPDKGKHVYYDGNLPASSYVENDIRQLVRLRNITWGEKA